MGKKKEEMSWIDELIEERCRREPSFRAALDAEELRIQLIQMRQKSGLTQKEVAKRLGVSQPRVAEIEQLRNDPQISSIVKYARAIGAELKVHMVSEPKKTAYKARTAKAKA